MILLAVELLKLTSEVGADLPHRGFAHTEQLGGEHLSTVPGDEHQVNVHVPDSVTTSTFLRLILHDANAIMERMKSRQRMRAYPEPGQREPLAQLFGCARVVFNDFIAESDRMYREEGRSNWSEV